MKKNKFGLSPEGPLHSISIHDIAFPNNYGVGKIDGYVLFVPGALPGDRVKAEIINRGKRFGYGLVQVHDSPPRLILYQNSLKCSKLIVPIP